MGNGILDFHRGTVDFLRCQLGLAMNQIADLQLPRLFQITVHLDLDCVKLQYYHVSLEKVFLLRAYRLTPYSDLLKDSPLARMRRAMTSRSSDQLSQHTVAYQLTGCNLAYSFLSCNSFANFKFDLVDNRCMSARLKATRRTSFLASSHATFVAS